MPIYEYKCGNCGMEFELLVYSSDAEKPACGHCESKEVTRLLSRFSTRGAGHGPAAASGESCHSCHGGKSCGSCR